MHNIDDILAKVKSNTATNEEVLIAQEYINNIRRNDLEAYTLYMLQDTGLQLYWFHRVILQKLQSYLDKQQGKLIVKMAPRHYKTLLCALMMGTYVFGKFPEWTTIYATYNDELASINLNQMLAFLQSDKYTNLFEARCKWNDEDIDKQTKKTKKSTNLTISNTRSNRGCIIGAGKGGTLTGRPGNLIIVDDYLKNFDDAKSEVMREAIWKWFNTVVKTRREQKSIMIVFATQWHHDDLIGRLEKENLENDDPDYVEWEILEFEAEKTERTMGNAYDKRQVGEYLIPTPEYRPIYADAKKDHLGWLAQFQCCPIDEYEAIFSMSDVKWYEKLPENMRIWISVDPNRKVTNNSDFIGITVWGVIKKGKYNEYYLINFERIKINHATLKQKIYDDFKKYFMKYGNCSVLIETNVAQSLYDDLKQILRGRIFEVYSTLKKEDRAQGLFLEFASGHVFLPTSAILPKIKIYTNELLSFTGKKNGKDDLVDSSAQLIIHLSDQLILLNSPKTKVPENHIYKRHFGNSKNILAPFVRKRSAIWQR